MPFFVACLSLFVSLLVFLTLVFLSGDRCPVVVVLASVLQHGLVPRDIEEMLEVGRLHCNLKVPGIDFPSFLCNSMYLIGVPIYDFTYNFD